MSATYPITILGKPDQDSFLIVSPNERRNQIKMIIRKEILVSVYVIDEEGNKTANFSTNLLGINQDRGLLILDTTPNEQLNQKITTGNKLYCATTINDVPIEFEIATPTQAKLAGRPVFVTQLPEVLVRMQRRDFFRVTIPSGVAAVCYFPTDEEAIKIDITDVSIGGLSITILEEFPLPFERNDIYEECEIQLSMGESFKVDLEVRNHIKKPGISNKNITQIGFAFKGISDNIQNQIQRFIFNIESKRLRTR